MAYVADWDAGTVPLFLSIRQATKRYLLNWKLTRKLLFDRFLYFGNEDIGFEQACELLSAALSKFGRHRAGLNRCHMDAKGA